MALAAANALSVWPDGKAWLYKTSPIRSKRSRDKTAAGRGLSSQTLMPRDNRAAKGAANSQAHIKRGASTSSGEVSASSPQPLPKSDSPAHRGGGRAAALWLR